MITADELQAMLDAATPGPWSAARNSAYWEVAPKREPLDCTIPLVLADVCASDPDHPDGGLQEANARLIALAPDLARKVIAAEKLVEIVRLVHGSFGGGLTMTFDERDPGIFAEAIAAWEAAQ
ncbi:hypothetical protein PE067_09200 [Paracoccus sp. DMF-8]|uniref:hypothetical protein n=1 Tax=Paracoccus sp. DMF-8 TaxID=3019445 RepID=UPI0023E7B246|nr:hypothetical protein [Paracoccus sp. DMF-8]MDF3606294.1 hypothetical protein [Paracoccus sp. DMF-8]